MNIIVDTCILIDYIRRKDKENSLLYKNFLIEDQNKAFISLTTVTELWAGGSMNKKAQYEYVETLIGKMSLLKPTFGEAQKAGELLRKYQLQFQDAQIAACAIENNMPLLTLNKKCFSQLKEISLYI